ncbi:hypothetical protein [Geodermatophilus sp. SYSU D00079]
MRLLIEHRYESGLMGLLADQATRLHPAVAAGHLDRVVVLSCLTAAAAAGGVSQRAADGVVRTELDRGRE